MSHYHAKIAKQQLLASSAMRIGASTKIAVHNAILKMSQSQLIDWPFKWWTRLGFFVKMLLVSSMAKKCLMEITWIIILNAKFQNAISIVAKTSSPNKINMIILSIAQIMFSNASYVNLQYYIKVLNSIHARNKLRSLYWNKKINNIFKKSS